jgi:hypothetical protein
MEEEVEDPILAKLNGKPAPEEPDPILAKLNAGLKKKDESASVVSKDYPGLSGLQQKLSEKSTENASLTPAEIDSRAAVKMMEYEKAKTEADAAMAVAFKDGNTLAPVPTKQRGVQEDALKKKQLAESLLNEARDIKRGKFSDTQINEQARDVVEGVRDTKDPITALMQTVKSGIADQIPKEYYVQRLRMSKGNFGDLFDPRSDLNAFGDKLPQGISREEFNIWNNSKPDKIRTKTYDDRARMFITQKLGADGYEKLKQQFTAENIQERVGFERNIQEQNLEAQAKTKGVIQNLKEVKGAMDFLNFAGNMLGQAVYRVPISLVTGPTGSIVSESAAVYDRQVDLIAEDKKISREEVIRRGLDEPAAGQAMAVMAGTLDAASQLNMVGMFRKAVTKDLTESVLKQFGNAALKGGVPEAVTESIQGELEEIGASQGAKTEYGPDFWRILSSGVGGFIGGGIIGGATGVKSVPQVVQEQREIIDPQNPASSEAAAKNIEEAINQDVGKYTFDKPITDAIPEQKTSEVPVQPETRDSQAVESGAPESGPQETTGTKTEGQGTGETEVQKIETETGPEAGKIEFKSEDKSKISDFANRVLSGEVIKNPEDLEFYNKNKDSINEELNRISFKKSAKERSQKEKTLDHPVLKKDYSDELTPDERAFVKKRGGGIYDEVIPARVIFKNDVLPTWEKFDKEKPALKQRFNKGEGKPETISIDDIIPTDPLQKKFQIRAKPDLKNKPLVYRDPEGQLLVTDGHHRIAEQILNGAKTIEALVIDESQPNPNESDISSETTQPRIESDVPVEQSPVDTDPSVTTDQPPPGDTDAPAGTAPGPETRTYAIAQRILASDASDSIKDGIRKRGSDYIPKRIDITDSEARSLIELYGEDKSEALIRDTKNDLTGDTRTALAARLYERYKETADTASDPQIKSRYYDKAVDIALTSAEQLKEAGRQTNAAKIWKAITQSEDMTVLAIERENQRQGTELISPIYKEVRQSQEQFEEQVRKMIAQKVTEGVEENLKRAKLITKERRQEISNAFDKLKVKDIGGAANDITRVLGAAVWNGSVEAVKRAVLAGADIANAIQAGVDYVRDNFKGQWDENEFRQTLEPSVSEMIPREPVKSSDIDQDAIKTPRLSGKKKKDFINQVVEAHNQGKLTDEKFDQLYAKQLGAREFSPEDRGKIRELAKTIAAVEAFESKVKDDFTRENIAKYKGLLEQAQRANAELQAFAQKPSNVWDTLISIMQGNLLSPLSLITNIYSNVALQPLRFLSTTVGSLVDYSVSQVAKTGLLGQAYRDTTIDLAELQKGYFQGNWNGLLEGLKQIKTGPKSDERSIREINNQFSPIRAIARWGDKNKSVGQKVNDYIEGTIGWPAEVMFRLLNLGDKPFRRGAELARTMELASKKGLTGQELEKFMMFPDEASAEQIKKAGDEATFQQENDVSKGVQKVLSWIINGIGKAPIIGGPLKVIAKSQVPFVKTPWNIMVETLQYAAFPVTGAMGIRQIVKGDKRSGSIMIGKAVVGAMIFAVAKELFVQGLMSWDEPYSKREGKQRERRQIQYDNIPPNALNVSAIQRGLLGDGWEIQDQDTWIDYKKLGVMGLLFDNYSNNYFSNIREDGQMPEQSDFYVDLLTVAPRVLSQSLDQSFLKGTNTLLTALQEGSGDEMDQWIIGTTGAITSIVWPNTLSTISKSEDEFIRDTRDDSFVEKLKNTYKTKFFIGEQLPPKVNLWGEKITGNPEGRNKYTYYLFDPSKFKNVDTENFKYKLYQAWKTDQFNDDWLPSIPKREITYRGVKVPLDPQMYSKYVQYVGQERARLVSTYVNSAGFERKNKEKVLEKLMDLYSEGRERGKKKFLMDTGWNVLTPGKLSLIGKK